MSVAYVNIVFPEIASIEKQAVTVSQKAFSYISVKFPQKQKEHLSLFANEIRSNRLCLKAVHLIRFGRECCITTLQH